MTSNTPKLLSNKQRLSNEKINNKNIREGIERSH